MTTPSKPSTVSPSSRPPPTWQSGTPWTERAPPSTPPCCRGHWSSNRTHLSSWRPFHTPAVMATCTTCDFTASRCNRRSPPANRTHCGPGWLALIIRRGSSQPVPWLAIRRIVYLPMTDRRCPAASMHPPLGSPIPDPSIFLPTAYTVFSSTATTAVSYVSAVISWSKMMEITAQSSGAVRSFSRKADTRSGLISSKAAAGLRCGCAIPTGERSHVTFRRLGFGIDRGPRRIVDLTALTRPTYPGEAYYGRLAVNIVAAAGGQAEQQEFATVNARAKSGRFCREPQVLCYIVCLHDRFGQVMAA